MQKGILPKYKSVFELEILIRVRLGLKQLCNNIQPASQPGAAGDLPAGRQAGGQSAASYQTCTQFSAHVVHLSIRCCIHYSQASLPYFHYFQDLVSSVLGLRHVGLVLIVFGLSHVTSTWMASQLIHICQRTKIIGKEDQKTLSTLDFTKLGIPWSSSCRYRPFLTKWPVFDPGFVAAAARSAFSRRRRRRSGLLLCSGFRLGNYTGSLGLPYNE